MNYKELVKQAVNKFLCWKLPEDFAPDGGISFDRSGHKYEPVGTNLFTAIQAERMFLDCLPELVNDETAWLVELQDDGAKWVGVEDKKFIWTTDPNKVIRFARKEDADSFKSVFCETAISSEHMWMGDR